MASPRVSKTVLSDLSTGILFKNPVPHLKSVHAYFPSVASLGDDGMLATYMVGEAFEAVGTRVHLSRSLDGGATWNAEGSIGHDLDGKLVSESARITATGNTNLVVLLHRHDRRGHPDEGLSNPANLGFVPTDFALTHSGDSGRTWSEPTALKPPLDGPSFELCSPITVLGDGRWLLPTSTWRGWDGALPNGNRMVAFVSTDNGRTWPSYLDVMHHESDLVHYWESKIVERVDGTLLATAWGYDEASGGDLPNQYALSQDGGATWSRPSSMGLSGQTLTPFVLKDGRIVCIYRRIDRAGLWVQLGHLEGNRWVNEKTAPLWGHDRPALTGSGPSMAENFQVLRFGAPCVTCLPTGSLFVAFWCYEDCVSVIRWFRFRIS